MTDSDHDGAGHVEELNDIIYNFFRRYLVGLAGAYIPIGPDESPIGEETFFCYSGFIYSRQDKWYFVTAGHCLEELFGHLDAKRIVITSCALVGLSGADPDESEAVVFYHYNDSPRHFVNKTTSKEGIDYGWIELRPYYQRLLEKAGVSPAIADDWADSAPGEIWGEILVGYPDELLNKDMNKGGNSGKVRGEVEPVIISVNRLTDIPQKYDGYEASWLIGKVSDACELASIVGTSGGPIIQIYETQTGKADYRLVALQSWWDKGSKIIFGCPIFSFLPKLKEEIDSKSTTCDTTQPPTS